MEALKTCGRCKQAKTFDNFNKDKNTKDGFACYCKICAKAIKKTAYRNRAAKQKEDHNNKSRAFRAKKSAAKAALKALTQKVDLEGYKTCYTCKKCKLLISFHKNKNNKDGLCGSCKECTITKSLTYYKKCDKTKRNEKRRANRKTNNKKIIAKEREYVKKNETKIKKYRKEYYQENKEDLRDKNNEYENNRRKTDPAFKLRKSISLNIRQNLKKYNLTKNGKSSMKYVSFTIEELKEHLEAQFESWMNWENWTVYDPTTWNDNDSSTWTWQIDHIQPQADFDFSNENEIRKCWLLSNLRPLSAKQNQIDGATRIRHKNSC